MQHILAFIDSYAHIAKTATVADVGSDLIKVKNRSVTLLDKMHFPLDIASTHFLICLVRTVTSQITDAICLLKGKVST